MSTNNKKIIVLSLLLSLLLTLSKYPIRAENKYIFVDKLKKTSLPYTIYKNEQELDFFYASKYPATSFKVIPFDLNNDGTNELFVSNPGNNGAFVYFWRIYEQSKNKYNQIGEMACTSIRLSKETTDNYMNIDCYTYRSMAEGYITSYKFFGKEYYHDNRIKVDSKDYYQYHPDKE